MRESIGSALLLNIVIVIVGVISAFLIGSIAYSKAFKAKNRIIAVIDEYDGICNFQGYGTDDCTKKIEEELKDMGYSSNISKFCAIENPSDNSFEDEIGIKEITLVYKGKTGYKYCVYRYDLCDYSRIGGNRQCKDGSGKYHYFKIRTFMHFDVPVIGSFLEFPVTGDTRTYIDDFPD